MYIIIWNLTVPSLHCSTPPTIDGAKFSSEGHTELGDRRFYICKVGYTNNGGDALLLCGLADDYSTEWVGSYLKCTLANSINTSRHTSGCTSTSAGKYTF